MILHWLCDSPSSYNAQLFQAVAADPAFRLTVHFRRGVPASHPWRTQLLDGYEARVLAPRGGVDWQVVGLALRPRRELDARVFVVAGWNHPTAWLLLALLGLRRARYLIWTDTPNLAVPRRGLRQAARRYFLRWVFRRAEGVMGTGRPAVKALRAMEAPADKLIDFPCWIDLQRYRTSARCRDAKAAKPLVFLSLGVIDRQKGHAVALRALAAAARETGRAFRYRIAGTGPEEARLRALAAELGIAEEVSLLGWLEPDAVIGELQEADVLLHPALTHEAYGVAVLEGMAAGLPVLASDRTCAALDRVEPGVNGWLHPAGDHEALAGQIAALLEEPAAATRMGEAARRTAEAWPLDRGVAQLKQLVGGRTAA